MSAINSTMPVNETSCIPLNNTDNWLYYNETKEILFTKAPDYANKSECEIERGMDSLCQDYLKYFAFDDTQLVRVIVTWTLFLISALGNAFVIYCVYGKARTSHVHLIMLHFAIADLAFTFLVSPQDAIWNTTMQWHGGAVLCKVCQTCKQIGMYVSSCMLVVMALDRYCGIVKPMSSSKQRKRTKYLVVGAWAISILCALPAAYMFNLDDAAYCPDQRLKQCIDFLVLTRAQMRPYLFFTMVMSFVAPMLLCLILYSLVACEINNMLQRDIDRLGRRDSSNSIRGARKKTLIMTSLVTLTFLVFWGPYYAYAVYYWFNEAAVAAVDTKFTTALFLLLYCHPAIHPFIYGILMRDVRETFRNVVRYVRHILTCGRSDPGLHPICISDRDRRRESQRSNARLVTQNGHATAGDHRRDETRSQAKRARDAEDDEHSGLLLNGGPCPEISGGAPNKPNGTARTSQVSFRLPNESVSSNANVGLNNNKEKFASGKEDPIIESSSV